MTRLDRYLLSELAAPTAQAVIFLCVLMVFGQLLRLADQFSSLGLSAPAIAAAVLYSFPPALAVILPLALLLGALLAFGRLSGDGELVALTAAGIPFARLMVGPLVLGVLVSLASAGLSIWGEPWGIRSLQRLLSDAVDESLSAGVQPRTFYAWLPGVMLYCDDRVDERLDGFVFVDSRQRGREVLVQARTAWLRPVAARTALVFELHDGEALVARPGSVTRLRFARNTYRLDLGQVARGAGGLFVTRQGLPLDTLWRQSSNPQVPARDRAMLRTTAHKKLALPLAAILFALLGCLLGGGRGRLSGWGRGLLIGLAVVGLYYYVLRSGELSAISGALPAGLAIWLPNAAYAALAAGLLWRRTRGAG